MGGVVVPAGSMVADYADGPSDRYLVDESEMMSWWMRDDGTAVIPIRGSLFHGSSLGMSSSMGSGYKTIAANVRAALDANPERIAAVIDSNGGEVQGCFACARKLRDMVDESGIPFWAFSNESMFSAAYAIGSQADTIVLPDTGGVASVGVVSTHVDYSAYLREEGVKVTFITSGDKKIVGSPYDELSERDLEIIQGRVDKYANLFFELVSSNRDMSVDQIRDAQASIFIGDDATQSDTRFADMVMDLDDFYYTFSQESNNTKVFHSQGDSMNKQQVADLQEKADRADSLQSDLDKANAKIDSLKGEVSEQSGTIKSLTADLEASENRQARYVEVMESEAAQGKQEKAQRLLADPKFNSFTASDLQEHLADMAPDKAESKSDADGSDPDDKATAALLAAAREKDSDTKGIETKGEGDKETDTAEASSAMKRSAEIVKRNRKRKHI